MLCNNSKGLWKCCLVFNSHAITQESIYHSISSEGNNLQWNSPTGSKSPNIYIYKRAAGRKRQQAVLSHHLSHQIKCASAAGVGEIFPHHQNARFAPTKLVSEISTYQSEACIVNGELGKFRLPIQYDTWLDLKTRLTRHVQVKIILSHQKLPLWQLF